MSDRDDAGLYRIATVVSLLILAATAGCISAPSPQPEEGESLSVSNETGLEPSGPDNGSPELVIVGFNNSTGGRTNVSINSTWVQSPNSSYPEFGNESIIGGCWTGGDSDE